MESGPDPCHLCGGRETTVRYAFAAHRIVRCADCTFMWLHPPPSAAQLREVYGADYYRNERFFQRDGGAIYGYHDYLSERFAKQQDIQEIVNRIVRLLGGAEGRFLDVGCGLGYTLDVAHDRGFAVEGVDFNPAAVEWVAAKYRFPATRGDFADYEGEPCAAVTMLDVIEHQTRPREMLEKAASVMIPGGILALSTMDSDSFASRLFGRRLEDFRRVREHLCFFNRRTMRQSLERAGFEVLSFESYGITIRMDALTRRARLALPVVGGMLERAARMLGLARVRMRFDPRTKMLVYARRR